MRSTTNCNGYKIRSFPRHDSKRKFYAVLKGKIVAFTCDTLAEAADYASKH